MFVFHLELGVAFEMRSIRGRLPGSSPPFSFLSSPPVTLGEKRPAPTPRGRGPQRRGPAAGACHSPARGHAAHTPSPTSLKDFFTSTRECQCAMGFRGYASISFQWSLPRPSALIPTRQTPMISLWPTLRKRQRARPALGTRHALRKGGPRGLGLCPAERRAPKGRGVSAAGTLCPASSGGQWTQTDERKVVNAFGVSGNGGQMA